MQTNLDLRNTTLGYGFHFQHRNSGIFLIESFAHDSGRILVRAEFSEGISKQQLKKISANIALNTVLISAHIPTT
jgi:hypothetical protein